MLRVDEPATSAFDISPGELRRMVLHGFKRSFFPGSYREKRDYVRKAIDWYDRKAIEHGLPKGARAAEP